MKKRTIRWPTPRGQLAIYPQISRDLSINVVILGDPKGLLYLAEVLRQLATTDQNTLTIPEGERMHLHIHPKCELAEHSVDVELCRADAKGTGEIPDFLSDC